MNRNDITLADLATLLTTKTGAQVDPDGIDDSTTFADIGVDSLGLLGVITSIEESNGVSLPSEAQQIESVKEFLAVVNDNVREK